MSIARVNTDYLIGAADAIRKKTGSQEAIPLPQFESEIENIPSPPPTGRLIYSDFDNNGLPQTLEYVPAHPNDTKLPDRFCSYGHQYTSTVWNSKIKNIICPNHITELGIGGFAMGGGVYKKLSNYDSIKIAGNSSFSGDISKWDYDYLPPNLEYIGNGAFFRSPFIDNTKFQIPNSVYYIGNSAFSYFSLRKSQNYLLLPEALIYLGEDAFFNNGFQLFPIEIIIPRSVDVINRRAFGGSAHLTEIITFKGKPTTINANAFLTSTFNDSMKNLTTINVPWSEGEVANAPWGAINATINYNYQGE